MTDEVSRMSEYTLRNEILFQLQNARRCTVMLFSDMWSETWAPYLTPRGAKHEDMVRGIPREELGQALTWLFDAIEEEANDIWGVC